MQTLTHRDIAACLQISVGKARKLLASGSMRSLEVADYGNGRKSRRVTEEEFVRWQRETMQKSAPKQPRTRIIARKDECVPKTLDEIFH